MGWGGGLWAPSHGSRTLSHRSFLHRMDPDPYRIDPSSITWISDSIASILAPSHGSRALSHRSFLQRMDLGLYHINPPSITWISIPIASILPPSHESRTLSHKFFPASTHKKTAPTQIPDSRCSSMIQFICKFVPAIQNFCSLQQFSTPRIHCAARKLYQWNNG